MSLFAAIQGLGFRNTVSCASRKNHHTYLPVQVATQPHFLSSSPPPPLTKFFKFPRSHRPYPPSVHSRSPGVQRIGTISPSREPTAFPSTFYPSINVNVYISIQHPPSNRKKKEEKPQWLTFVRTWNPWWFPLQSQFNTIILQTFQKIPGASSRSDGFLFDRWEKKLKDGGYILFGIVDAQLRSLEANLGSSLDFHSFHVWYLE